MLRRMRALAISLIALCLGCGEPAAIIDAPDLGFPGNPKLTPCNDENPCQAGQQCVDSLCQSDTGSTGGTTEGTTTATPPDPQDAGTSTGEPEDIVEQPLDEGGGSTGTPDPGGPPDEGGTTGPPDPGQVVPDPGPPDPPVEACTIPGKGDDCEQPFQETCRIEDGALTCSGSFGFGPFNSNCSEHAHCDLLFGCHFSKCTTYCQLQFGNAECIGALPNCKNVGHATWGACSP